MSYTTFNTNQVDATVEPMFLGQGVNLARYDKTKYRFLDLATDQQFAQFWRPEEVDLSRDKVEFWSKLTDEQRYIFLANLKYQSLLDSVQARAPMLAFGPLISIPELETFTVVWPAFEVIHSKSYTHIIRNVFPDPGAVFDSIVVDENIINRAQALTRAYDELIELGMIYSVYGYGYHVVPSRNERVMINPSLLRRAIIKALAAVNALEGVRFYVSFLCSFAFTEKLNVMAGNSKIIRFIARDEALHRKAIGDTLKAIAAGKEGAEWKADFEAVLPELKLIFQECFDQEVAWAQHLFSEGRSIPGLNASILEDCLKVFTAQTMAGAGIQPLHETPSPHPAPWVNKYLYSGNVQVAPQEAEISSYLLGRVLPELRLAELATISLDRQV